MTHPATRAFLDAKDELATVRDILDLIGMAHRLRDNSDDARAVHAGVVVTLEHLEKAEALLERIRPVVELLPSA